MAAKVRKFFVTRGDGRLFHPQDSFSQLLRLKKAC